MTDLRKNEVFTCEITGYTAQGAGVAHIHDRAVFVPETVAGETWEVKLVRVTASVQAFGVPCRLKPQGNPQVAVVWA